MSCATCTVDVAWADVWTQLAAPATPSGTFGLAGHRPAEGSAAECAQHHPSLAASTLTQSLFPEMPLLCSTTAQLQRSRWLSTCTYVLLPMRHVPASHSMRMSCRTWCLGQHNCSNTQQKVHSDRPAQKAQASAAVAMQTSTSAYCSPVHTRSSSHAHRTTSSLGGCLHSVLHFYSASR